MTRALSEAGISKYWAYRRRAADPDFAARWGTAMRAGERVAARVAESRARRPGGGARDAAAGLIVQGRAGTNTKRLQPAARDSFTAERRAAFLDALRATCNVQASCKATGAGSTTAYYHYHSDAGFRAAWEAALAEGRVHLEMALMGAARALFEAPAGGFGEQSVPPVAPGAITGMDAKVALQLLRLHAPRDAGGRTSRRSLGRWIKPADAEATRREILAKVAAVRASLDPSTASTGSGQASLGMGGLGVGEGDGA